MALLSVQVLVVWRGRATPWPRRSTRSRMHCAPARRTQQRQHRPQAATSLPPRCQRPLHSSGLSSQICGKLSQLGVAVAVTRHEAHLSLSLAAGFFVVMDALRYLPRGQKTQQKKTIDTNTQKHHQPTRMTTRERHALVHHLQHVGAQASGGEQQRRRALGHQHAARVGA